MKSILKYLRKQESLLENQRGKLDHELTGIRGAIDALGGKIATVKTRVAKVRNYSHKPWTAERRKKFFATIKAKKALATKAKRKPV